jgi:predicted nucleic acid-binding protein
MSPGLLDTNIVIHAQTNDALAAECRGFLAKLERGEASAVLDALVLHELSYALGHYLRQLTRAQTAAILLGILQWPGIEAEKDLLSAAIEIWRDHPQLGFVDAYLGARATREDRPVFTKNVAHLRRAGAEVPDPLPS